MTPSVLPTENRILNIWDQPAVITRNNFVHKSLSSFSFNHTVGCMHGCRFCYVPEVSTRKMSGKLAPLGVRNPDEQWGSYAFLRRWDEKAFLASLRKAEQTPVADLNADGHRAVMFSTTTDPYQVFAGPDSAQARDLTNQSLANVRRALELILENSTLRVRILTRGPLARQHFDVYEQFGDRLLFGMSLPTLDDELLRVYEPKAPAASQRLKTLQEAHKRGLNVYVAMAPTFPDCDENDFRRTLTAVKELNPVTVFHEPINIRAENVQRIATHAQQAGRTLCLEVFDTRENWRAYALQQLRTIESIAGEVGLGGVLHLWPDDTLKSGAGFRSMHDHLLAQQLQGQALTVAERKQYREAVTTHHQVLEQWSTAWHSRISEWPSVPAQVWNPPAPLPLETIEGLLER